MNNDSVLQLKKFPYYIFLLEQDKNWWCLVNKEVL